MSLPPQWSTTTTRMRRSNPAIVGDVAVAAAAIEIVNPCRPLMTRLKLTKAHQSKSRRMQPPKRRPIRNPRATRTRKDHVDGDGADAVDLPMSRQMGAATIMRLLPRRLTKPQAETKKKNNRRDLSDADVGVVVHQKRLVRLRLQPRKVNSISSTTRWPKSAKTTRMKSSKGVCAETVEDVDPPNRKARRQKLPRAPKSKIEQAAKQMLMQVTRRNDHVGADDAVGGGAANRLAAAQPRNQRRENSVQAMRLTRKAMKRRRNVLGVNDHGEDGVDQNQDATTE